MKSFLFFCRFQAYIVAAVLLSSTYAHAAGLTTGLTIAAPGSTVSVPIDLVNPGAQPFSSIDAAVRILGSGDTPMITGYDAPAAAPYVWETFSGVNYLPAPNNPLPAPVKGEVFGVAGSDLGVQANLEGRVMDLSVTVPATAVPGNVFQIDLIEDLSFISNQGSAEHFSQAFQDGQIKVVTNQILTDYNCVQSNLFTTESCGDLNSDGFVDVSDYNIVLGQINSLAAPAAVPEPNLACWMIFTVLGLGAFRRRR